MSQAAGGRTPRPSSRWFDLVAVLVIGIAIVGAALIPAVTANSGETTTVSGDVSVGGKALPFFPVGFWTTADGVVVSTTTDANGQFSLDIPITLDGYAYAGSAPDAQRAVVQTDGRSVVRGVISANAANGTPPVLYQGYPTATAHALAGGASTIRFRLQEAGRISGTSPVPTSGLKAVQIRRADNSVVQTLKLDARSRFRSMLLAPGQYGVVLVPKSPGLPVVANAVVRSGATTEVTLTRPVTGATVLGTVRTDAGAVGAGVPVLLEQDGEVIASTTTTSTGDWSFAGVAAGDLSVEVGRFDEPAASSASASAVEVQIPGASPSPTPTASTASPSPSATTPTAAAIAPVDRTSDGVLPQSFSFTVPAVLGEVGVATQVREAGRLAGTVSVTSGTGEQTAVQVVVEEATTERVVRVATADANGRYRVGGLEPDGRYRVYAVTQPDDATLAQMGGTSAIARTTATTADVVVDRAALTLSGTVSNATSGSVALGDSQLLERSGTIDASGAYALQGLVPGAYPVVVTAATRKASLPVGVVVAADQPVVDLQSGPKPATFKGWFIASGAGVPALTGTATDVDGRQVRFGPTTSGGHVTIGSLTPGTYEYDADSFRGSAPVLDGAWYYLAPVGTFSLSDGAITDVGPIVLHVRSH